MNGQIVLCKGINDGEELEKSIRDLTKYIPCLESVSVVPVGLSRFREGLYPLEMFTPEDAEKVLSMVHGFQDEIFDKHGTHFIHAADEFYILAGRDIPDAESYDGYLQYENGVGMIRSFLDEFHEALAEAKEEALSSGGAAPYDEREISIANGVIMKSFMEDMIGEIRALYPKIRIHYYPVVNQFFGETITVSGLLTGQDILRTLKGRELGSVLYLPSNLLKSDSELFLDDLKVSDLEDALQVRIKIIESDGFSFFEEIVGKSVESEV